MESQFNLQNTLSKNNVSSPSRALTDLLSSEPKKLNSKELFETSKMFSPGGVHSPVRAFKNVGMYPRFIASANAAELKDVEGNTYIDFCNAWGALLFGHQDPDIKFAIHDALSRGWVYGMAEPYSLKLCQLIQSIVPWAEKIRITNSGTEAVMSAIRVARAFKNRPKILKFDGCYHGHCDSVLVRSGSGLAEMAEPDSAGVTKLCASETLVCPLDDLNALEEILAKHHTEIACLIMEPLPANNGLLIQKTAYLKSVRELCTKYDVLLIFDEVISGFRVGLQGMAGLYSITPDLVTYGKVVGGGASIAVFAGRRDIMDYVAPEGPVYQAGTYAANGIAVSAAIVNLEKLRDHNPYPKLRERTETFCKALNQISEEYKGNHAADMKISWQSFESIFWPIFNAKNQEIIRTPTDIPKNQKADFAKYFSFLVSKGIMLSPSGFEVGFLSMSHTSGHLDYVLQSTKDFFETYKNLDI